jgi:N-acetyl-anhydromuramyl-L-alanine amidase AmpD
LQLCAYEILTMRGHEMAKQLKKGSKGEQVRKVQRALVKLGYGLPKFGVDGDLGHETLAALQEFAAAHGVSAEHLPHEDAPIDAALIEDLLEIAAAKKPPKPRGVQLVDATAEHPNRHAKGVRPWTSITGVTLHQTGIYMQNTARRFHRLRAHIGIIDPGGVGTIVQVYPLDTLLWHANGLNPHTVGIEINGLFEGVEGQGLPRYQRHLKLCHPSAAQIEAARKCLGWIAEEVGRHGGKLEHVYAHRQSSSTRRADPGSRVWQDVALWAEENLGLATRPTVTYGKGRPIPVAWDPRQTGVRY